MAESGRRDLLRYSRKVICNNWRRVTLLPVISKTFCKMLLERIKKGVDKKLRKEQAGFQPKRSTTEQIFILRNILEQADEWRKGLYAQGEGVKSGHRTKGLIT